MTSPVFLLVVVLVGLAVSAVGPRDRFTWYLEVAPVLIGIPILLYTRKRLSLTTLSYVLLALHALILILGGHYTYAEVPLGFWVKEALGLARNHYDRLGHFAQGFVPAIVGREILLRRGPLRPGGWTFFLVTCVCLAISATYELIEWVTALMTGEAADAFLGTQGDPWDTQWDMFLALCGALAAQVFLARVHDGQLARLSPGSDAVS
jgi:putative membrane protein